MTDYYLNLKAYNNGSYGLEGSYPGSEGFETGHLTGSQDDVIPALLERIPEGVTGETIKLGRTPLDFPNRVQIRDQELIKIRDALAEARPGIEFVLGN